MIQIERDPYEKNRVVMEYRLFHRRMQELELE